MPTIKEALLGTEEQNRKGQEMLDKQARGGSKIAKLLGGKSETAEEESRRKEVEEGIKEGDRKAAARKYGNVAERASKVDAMGNATGMKKGGKVSSASKRADGIAIRGKTRA